MLQIVSLLVIALLAALALLKDTYRWAVRCLVDQFLTALAQLVTLMLGGVDFMLLASQILLMCTGFLGSISVGTFSAITV